MGGISDYLKESANGEIPNTFYYGRAIDYRFDPQSITLLPGAIKESGSVLVDLPKWGEPIPEDLSSYYYGDLGTLYYRSPSGSWSNIRTVANAHGNGLSYFVGDSYLYYSTDSALGRYGPLDGSATPAFSDNFLQAQGGVPLNTASVSLDGTSDASAADSATLSITSDLTLETFFKATTLPAVGDSATLVGKWDESGALRSYILDLYGVSGFFGDGADGDFTITTGNTVTNTPIDAACTGIAGTQILNAINASFAVGKPIYIWQTQGTNAGQWEEGIIQGYDGAIITTDSPLKNTYTTGAQVIQIPQYTAVEIQTGATWIAKAWNGTTGGLLTFKASVSLTIDGIVTATGKGFRGGSSGFAPCFSGEGIAGPSTSANPNSNGGGGAQTSDLNGGGGANQTPGTNGVSPGHPGVNGLGGLSVGSADLTTFTLGGGGGPGENPAGGNGGNGGGGIYGIATNMIINSGGSIVSDGGNGGSSATEGAGGGGGGGPILLKAQVFANNGLIEAIGGNGGTPGSAGAGNGGSGGYGYTTLNYLTSYTPGTITPTLNPILDNTLVTTTTIQARLGISNNGTLFEYLTQNLPTLTIGVWNRLSVSWDASASLANFYLNAVPLGMSVGTKTAISNNTSLLYVGASKGASIEENFFNGLLNDMRIWSQANSAEQIAAQNLVQLTGQEGNLAAYYKFNSTYIDSSPNGNTLVNNGTTFTSDVPFPAPSTRLDIDQSQVLTGQTYTTPLTIIEDAVDLVQFTPQDDPQASAGFVIDTRGTGDLTLIVHDTQNRVIATSVITHANVPLAGAIEFFFTPPWRIVIGKTYHFHLISTVANTKVVTGTANNFATVNFHTYFGFLVNDSQFHPITPFLRYEVIGNERYLALWDGAFYQPNAIVFPPQWKVRCFGFWREYLAVGMWRGPNITSFDRGRIYFWDGSAPTFNFFIDIAEGQINALLGIDSDLYMFAGYRGLLMDYQGTYASNGSSQSQKIKHMPQLATSDYTEVYPGAFTMWRGLLHFGLYANSNSTTAGRGVYSFGTLNQMYPQTLSFDYVSSTGNYGNTVTIGSITPVGQSLIVCWRDGGAEGADIIDFNNPPAAIGELQTLTMDDNSLWHESSTLSIRADFLPLKEGESIEIERNFDRTGWTSLTTGAVISQTFVKDDLGFGRTQEYAAGVIMRSINGTSPTLLALSMFRDTLDTEKRF